MSKVKINYSLNGKVKELNAIKSKNTLSFIDDNIKTKIELLKDNIILYRETDEYNLKLDLKEKKGYCELKSHGNITLDIKSVEYSNKDDIINITYHIEEKVNIVIRGVA